MGCWCWIRGNTPARGQAASSVTSADPDAETQAGSGRRAGRASGSCFESEQRVERRGHITRNFSPSEMQMAGDQKKITSKSTVPWTEHGLIGILLLFPCHVRTRDASAWRLLRTALN